MDGGKSNEHGEFFDNWRRRDVSLGPECNDDVKLWSVTARIFASIFSPGVSAAAALTQIERLACWSAKQANTTTLVLNGMLEDLNSVRHALLQNRAAIDFLLLAQGHGCEDIDGMCCFNLCDHSVSIHKQLQWMQEHTQKIKEESDPFGNWLNRLFGGVGSWLKQLLKVFAIGLAISVCILICLPCCVGCLQNSLQQMMEKTFDHRIEYHRLRERL
ncbi:syncytin-A-like [Gallus gallus]|uniref:syncytin-A-like n=1 Tax=Gallus gallus TaxID=9031 RepID=UPI001F01F1EE|nr:syncytin-A-like [Gallus gallus]XP_046790406.1 syncytin-A-like [Gallus gallus]